MAVSKRHHWWPEVQSNHWTLEDGTLCVIESSGTFFRTSPLNAAVVGHLYSREDSVGNKDQEIENWFANNIESPFASAIESLTSLKNLRVHRFLGTPDATSKRDVEYLGYKITDEIEIMVPEPAVRSSLLNYLAAQVVRVPAYLERLTKWHQDNNSPSSTNGHDKSSTLALENMLFIYRLYRQEIEKAQVIFTIADCDREFLFSDGVLVSDEPWRNGPMPFDISFPLTPKINLAVLPVPNANPTLFHVCRMNAQGVSRLNRIVVGNAKRFVFARSHPPLDFIKKNFGKPAPKTIGFRWLNGQLETKVDMELERNYKNVQGKAG